MARTEDSVKNQDPTSGNSGSVPDELPTLSDLLIGFQKSMARVAQATAKATREDPLFLYGRRNLYYIDEVDVETVVLIRPEEEDGPGGRKSFETIRILTEEKAEPPAGDPGAGLTKLKFKLVGRSLDEPLDKPLIFLRMETYRKRQKDYLIEVQFLRGDGTPTACDDFTVEVLPDAVESKKQSLSGLATDEMGTAKLRLVFKKDPKAPKRKKVILIHGRKGSPNIADTKLYLIRAFAKGEHMRPKVEDEKIISYSPLIIDRTEFEEE